MAGLVLGVLIATSVVVLRTVRPEPAQRAAGPPPSTTRTTQPVAKAPEPEQDRLPPAPGAAPCTVVRVVASYENRPLLDALAAAYQSDRRSVAGHCVALEIRTAQSGLAASDAAAGFPTLAAGERPAIWAPDSSAWLVLARAKATTEGRPSVVPAATKATSTTPIVLAMPAPLAEASGWTQDPPSWPEYVQAAGNASFWQGRGQSQWGTFQIGRTSPLTATSGLLGLLAEYGALAEHLGDLTAPMLMDAQLRDRVRTAELAVVHYMASQEHFFWHIRQAGDAGDAHGFVSAVTADEKAVWDYNRGMVSRDGVTREQLAAPAVLMEPVYPRDGTFLVDNPLAVLDAEWVDAATRSAAADLARYAGTAQGQAVVRASGYRDLAGRADPQVAGVGRYRDGQATRVLPAPGARVLSEVQASFPAVRKRARVLFAVDLSNSMRQLVPDGRTRLAAAQSAIVAALEHFTEDDEVGLAGFSNTSADTAVRPGVIVPVAPLGGQHTALVDAVNGLQPADQTPLYAAAAGFADTMAGPEYDPNKINAVVLLSDGRNDTVDPTTAAEMAQRLTDLGHQKQVLIFTLAFADDADKPALQEISKLTHAHYYDASDPATLTRVLGDLVTSF